MSAPFLLLSDTDCARIFRRVTGATRWDQEHRELMAEIEAAVRAPLLARIAELEQAERQRNVFAQQANEYDEEVHRLNARIANLESELTRKSEAIQKLWKERDAALADQPKPQPRGFLMHWPAMGGGRRLIWDDSRIAGDAIGCPVEPVFSFGIDAARTPKDPAVFKRCAAGEASGCQCIPEIGCNAADLRKEPT